MFEVGKIPPEILNRIVMEPIGGTKIKRQDIVLRPKTGEDCCAVDTGEELCVLSTDPITGATKDIGYLAVQINCNDIFSSGAEPMGILMTILLPPGSTEEMLKSIMDGALKAANELGIEILGGHTEVTDAVCKPIVSATVVGKSQDREILCTGNAELGQDVIMTKWAGLEGTAILAKDMEEDFLRHLSRDIVERAQKLDCCLSVGKEARIARAHGATAMHDATEGGILGAVWEVAECSNLGIEVYVDKIPVMDETKEICQVAGIDPTRLISSGSMVIATEDGEGLLAKLAAAGIHGAIIGKMTAGDRVMKVAGETTPLSEPERDELYNAKVL